MIQETKLTFEAFSEAIPVGQLFYCTDQSGRRRRALRENDEQVFVFLHGCRKYGFRQDVDVFLKQYKPCIPAKKDLTADWHRRIARARKCLEGSGLWPDLLPYLDNLSKMTWEDRLAIDRLYWSQSYPRDFSTEEWQQWFTKYPFLMGTAEDGTLYPETEYFWEKSEVKLESMYFGKNRNQAVKDSIRDAVAAHRKYGTGRITVSYDHSFDYDPDRNMAWYSKEYRNCGNGYYYLALDHGTAWFIEKD